MLPRKPDHILKRPKQAIGWAIAILGLTSAAANSAWQAPFSEYEKANAQSVALSYQENQPNSLRSSQVKEEHPLGYQILLIEPKEQKKSQEQNINLAEVFVFNHHTHSAHLTLVDLSSNTVIHSNPITGVHLPLSDEEIAYSINAVRQDYAVQSKLSEEHASLAHNMNRDVLSGLQLRVAIWVPTRAEQTGESRCHLERCAFISLFDAESVSYAIEPVVNLKTGQVFIDLIQ